MTKTRDQLLLDFCKAASHEAMTKVAQEALDSLAGQLGRESFLQAQIKKLQAQVAHQSKTITDLENCLKGR